MKLIKLTNKFVEGKGENFYVNVDAIQCFYLSADKKTKIKTVLILKDYAEIPQFVLETPEEIVKKINKVSN